MQEQRPNAGKLGRADAYLASTMGVTLDKVSLSGRVCWQHEGSMGVT